jgi:hypothetical protein
MAVVSLGIAAAAGMLAAVLAGSLVAQDRSVAEHVSQIPSSARAVRALWFGVPGQGETYAALDRLARAATVPVLDRDPTAVVLFRESTIAGRFIGLGAVDDLARWVRVDAGRLPRKCTPRRCEVLRVRGSGPLPSVPGLRLVSVGRGDLTSSTLFGDAIPPAENALGEAELSAHFQRARRYHRPPAPPLVLAEGVTGLVSSTELPTTYRTYGWVVPLEPADVHPWTIDGVLDRIERARTTLTAESVAADLTAPTGDLAAAQDASRVAGKRLALLGGQAAALLLAFAVLAATRMRRDVEVVWRRLTWLGAPRWQLAMTTAVELVVVAALGVAAGWALGGAVAAALAREANLPAGDILAHSVLSAGGLLLAAALAGTAAAVVGAVLAIGRVRIGGLTLSPLDLAAVGALAVTGVALARGEADEAALLRDRGTGVVLLLIPALVAFAGAVVVARTLPPVLRLLERVVPRRAVPARLAAISLARNPGYAAAAVAFLVVSIGLALFAETYRATLARGHDDQAAFAVPADFVVREDLSRLIPVREVATPARLERLRAGEVYPVTRLQANVPRAANVTGITLLGVDADLISRLDGWRDDFARSSPAALARRIDAAVEAELDGPDVPADTRSLALRVSATGPPITLVALVRTRDGAFSPVDLGTTNASRPVRLVAPLPAEARGGRVIALRLLPPERTQERGADAGEPARGTLVLEPIAARRDGIETILTDFAEWRGVAGVRRIGHVQGLRTMLRFTVTNQVETYFRPAQPTDGMPVPAIASPRLAALIGKESLLPLNVTGQTLVTRVVGTAERFPGTSGDFVVADERVLATALNAGRPGSGFTTEVWVEAASTARRAELVSELRRPPFDVLEVDSRSERLDDLRREPIARASLLMLAAAAVVALVLALTGLLLGTIADLRDDSGELFDLEAQGASPASLRRHMRLRASVVGLFGVAGGALVGAVLSALVVSVVALTASGTRAEPPLVLTVRWPIVAAAAAGGIALAALVVGVVTAAAFRAESVARYGEAAE